MTYKRSMGQGSWPGWHLAPAVKLLWCAAHEVAVYLLLSILIVCRSIQTASTSRHKALGEVLQSRYSSACTAGLGSKGARAPPRHIHTPNTSVLLGTAQNVMQVLQLQHTIPLLCMLQEGPPDLVGL